MASEEKPKTDLGLLEEDDEFEEFPVEGALQTFFVLRLLLCSIARFSVISAIDGFKSEILSLPCVLDWTAADEEQGDTHVWEDDWDDTNVEDPFSNQLR